MEQGIKRWIIENIAVVKMRFNKSFVNNYSYCPCFWAYLRVLWLCCFFLVLLGSACQKLILNLIRYLKHTRWNIIIIKNHEILSLLRKGVIRFLIFTKNDFLSHVYMYIYIYMYIYNFMSIYHILNLSLSLNIEDWRFWKFI